MLSSAFFFGLLFVRLHFLLENNIIMSVEYNCFRHRRSKVVVFIDLVISIHREFVHSLVVST